MDVVMMILVACWTIIVTMAPYLLLGFLFAGLLSVVVSPELVERHLGQGSNWEILKASLFGVPLPLCSCGVLPVAASLRRNGAGKPATTAFLLSTPQTGVDSIAITWALLGPVLAILRPIVALLTGILGGYLIKTFVGDEVGETDDRTPGNTSSTCCNSEGSGASSGSCCSEAGISGSVVIRGLRYGLLTLPRDIGRALLIGILLSGLISALLRPGMIEAAGVSGFAAYPLAMLIGIPLYVCATASTPIAAGLIAAGISPGAALVFLISGPATNMAALTTLMKILGRRAVAWYLTTVVIASLATGILVDLFLHSYLVQIPAISLLSHSDSSGGFGLGEISAVLLLVVLAVALRPRSDKPTSGEQELDQIHLEISGMRCAGCSETIRRNLAALDGITEVQVGLKEGAAIVQGEGLDVNEIRQVVESLGYGVVFDPRFQESMLTEG